MIDKSECLLSSVNSNEDASIFKIDENLALVQTLDFITPVVNDPFIFGQIAAANSLSDVFAMGAEVINALNIVGFDAAHFSEEMLSEILQGGKDKVKECKASIVGGHSIQTPEMYYGLSVTGRVNPNKFWSNNTAKEGDLLILTKPLGTGIISTAIKADFLNKDEFKDGVENMRMLNYYAIDALKSVKVNACTDITGFGLLGHMLEMLRDDISFEVFSKNIPILSNVQKCIDNGLIPAGSYRNLEFISNNLGFEPNILFCDAQTSGGLLLSINANDANKALQNLKNCGYEKANIIAEVKPRNKNKISIIDIIE